MVMRMGLYSARLRFKVDFLSGMGYVAALGLILGFGPTPELILIGEPVVRQLLLTEGQKSLRRLARRLKSWAGEMKQRPP